MSMTLRWEKASRSQRPKGIAERFFADGDGGRYLVERHSYSEFWSAQNNKGGVRNAPSHGFKDRWGAQQWCIDLEAAK